MASCNYHPIKAASFECRECQMDLCESCVDDRTNPQNPVCFRCNANLVRLAGQGSVLPFWRRLQEIFRYPLASATITLIIGVSLLQCFLMYIPLLGILTFIPIILLSGILLKYCMVSLVHTAHGDMSAPEISEAYSGGLELFIKFISIHFCMGLIIFGFSRLSPTLALSIAFLFAIGYPAIMIRFAQTEQVLDSIHPLNILQLMSAIGLPYGLLLTFLGIMMASMGVLNELLGGAEGGILSIAMQTIVTNYYSVAMCHLLGYVLFQYQHRLGYSANMEGDTSDGHRSDQEVLLAKIDVMLKEGSYDEVVNLFYDGFKAFPDDRRFYDQYFQFIYNCRNARLMAEFAEKYLSFLDRMRNFDRLNSSYKMITQINPTFDLQSPKLRHTIARACRSKGDPMTAIKLINGMHKRYPEYPQLVDAFECMADALDDIPSKAKQVKQCRELIEKLKASTNKVNLESKKGFKKAPASSPAKQFDTAPQQDLPPIQYDRSW